MIHVITGAPCSGKSTYIKEHKAEGDLVVDYDEIAFCLGSAEKHNAKGIVKKASFEARESAIKTALNNPEKESWIVHTSPSKEQLKRYEEVGAEIIVLDTSKDECLARAEQDNRPQVTFDGIERYFAEQKGAKKKMKTKEFGVKYKDEGNGSLEGYASTWIREPDSYGDIVKEGAFTNTLKERWNGGEKIPLLWSHKMDDLSSYIGIAKADEDEKGLHFVAEFDGTDEAQRVRGLYKDGRLSKFSFAYDIKDAAIIELDDGRQANELRELDLFEISCVCVPANDDAGVVGVKSVEPEQKSGRRNSQKDADTIKKAIDGIKDNIKSLESLLEDNADDTEKDDKPETEVEPEVNEASEEQTDNGNAKRASDLLEKINQFKEDSTNES